MTHTLHKSSRLIGLCLLLILSACALPTATPDAPDDAIVLVPTDTPETPILTPTDTVEAQNAEAEQAEVTEEEKDIAEAEALAEPSTEVAVEEPTDWTQVATLEGDLYILGNPAAPIRLVDFSDFM